MIFDCLENSKTYCGVNPLMEQAFSFLEECVRAPKSPGRYEIKGDELYAMVQEYATSVPEAPLFEAHNRYIDIQCVLSGSELIRYAPRNGLEEAVPYSPDKDAVLYACDENAETMRLAEGCFAVFFPQDGHIASIYDGISDYCHKVVVKVRC